MDDLIGLIGSLCFAFSSWPQAYLSLKNKSARGIKWSFILLWLSGSFFSTIYAVALCKYVLLPNYICGGLGTGIILIVKMRETLGEQNKKYD